jgi:glycerol uptake facilitator-like aquaporin
MDSIQPVSPSLRPDLCDAPPLTIAFTLSRHFPPIAFVHELVLTAFLMFVIMAVATDTLAVGVRGC